MRGHLFFQCKADVRHPELPQFEQEICKERGGELAEPDHLPAVAETLSDICVDCRQFGASWSGSILQTARCGAIFSSSRDLRLHRPFPWRRERDSNPRSGYKPLTHFPGVLLQ